MSDNILLTLDEQGRAPLSRVKSPESAKELYGHLKRSRDKRADFESRLKSVVDGNAPFSAAELSNRGESWRANFNTGTATSMRSVAQTPYFELFASSVRYVDVQLDEDNPDDAQQWSTVASEEFDRLLKDDKYFDFKMWQAIGDFVYFGKAFFMWDGLVDWQPLYVEQGRVLFPDGTNVDPDNWDVLAVEQKIPVHKLYAKIRDPEVALASGWHPAGVIQAIIDANGEKFAANDPVALQNMLRDNDMATGYSWRPVSVAHLYVREFDGRWSHFIVTTTTQNPHFLFGGIGRFADVHQFIAPLFYEAGDNTVNGLSGLGKLIFPQVSVIDRLTNALVDGGFINSSVVLNAQDAGSIDELSLVHFGPTTVVPSGTSVVQGQITADLRNVLAVIQSLDSQLQSNTSVFRPTPDPRRPGNPPTARQVSLEFERAQALSTSAVSRFYNQWDQVLAEIYRRLTLDDSPSAGAKTFVKWARDREVPLRALRKTRSVRAMRAVGAGSSTQRQQALVSLLAISNRFPERGRRNLDEDLVAALTNQQKVDRYLQANERPRRDEWEATQENAALHVGAPVLRTDDQDDLIHARVHVRFAADIITASGQGGDIGQMAVTAQRVLAHVGADHVPQLSSEQQRAFGDVIAQLTDQIEELRQTALATQEAERAEQGQDPDQRRANAALQAKLQMQTAKTQQQMNLREAQAQQKMRLSEAETLAKIQRADIEQAAEQAEDVANAGR